MALLTNPKLNASSPKNTREVIRRSNAFASPINLGKIQATPCSAINPLEENEVVSFASFATNRMSAYSANIRPTPAQGPFIIAIIGLGHLYIYENRPEKFLEISGPKLLSKSVIL